MVFPKDPKWQYELQVARGIHFDTKGAVNDVRYRTWGNERLLIQCVKRFMPWVRDIIILLARPSQVQPWMKEEGVRVVFHKQFIPKEKLPIFNSMGFEMFLNRIPGLSEYFLYGNDDMFPVAPLKESDFFRASGASYLPCQHHEVKNYPAIPNVFQRACMNALNFAGEEFGIRHQRTWIKGGHIIAPMVKSTINHFWERDPERMMNSVTQFRSAQNFIQYLFSYWHHVSGQYVDHTPDRKYVSTNNTIEEVRKAIRDCNGVLCVNDNEAVTDIREYAEVVREEIEIKLRK